MTPYGYDGTEGSPDIHRADWIHASEVALAMTKAFTLPEVAEAIGISLRQVQMHITDGNLTAIDVGRGNMRRDLRVLDVDLAAFVEARRVRGVEPVVAPAKPAADGYIARRAARLARSGDA